MDWNTNGLFEGCYHGIYVREEVGKSKEMIVRTSRELREEGYIRCKDLEKDRGYLFYISRTY